VYIARKIEIYIYNLPDNQTVTVFTKKHTYKNKTDIMQNKNVI
jgi:hypothetical protein